MYECITLHVMAVKLGLTLMKKHTLRVSEEKIWKEERNSSTGR